MRRPLDMAILILIVILILIENETWTGGEKDPELVADGNVPLRKFRNHRGCSQCFILHS